MNVLINKFNRITARITRKRAVYTCMFGFSERFVDRKIINDGKTDYICFTDDRSLTSATWKIVYKDSEKYGPQKTSKLIKTCPHLFLPQYETSLYVDNTVRMNAAPSDVWSYLSKETPFITYKHPFWDCPYIETEQVKAGSYADPKVLDLQIEDYERAGLPKNTGLLKGAILLRRHCQANVMAFGDDWFQEIQKYTYRDQVALCYLAWKTRFPMGVFPGSVSDDNLFYWPDDVGPRLPRGFVDRDYLELNPDIALGEMTPREHFFKVGLAQGLRWHS